MALHTFPCAIVFSNFSFFVGFSHFPHKLATFISWSFDHCDDFFITPQHLSSLYLPWWSPVTRLFSLWWSSLIRLSLRLTSIGPWPLWWPLHHFPSQHLSSLYLPWWSPVTRLLSLWWFSVIRLSLRLASIGPWPLWWLLHHFPSQHLSFLYLPWWSPVTRLLQPMMILCHQVFQFASPYRCYGVFLWMYFFDELPLKRDISDPPIYRGSHLNFFPYVSLVQFIFQIFQFLWVLRTFPTKFPENFSLRLVLTFVLLVFDLF